MDMSLSKLREMVKDKEALLQSMGSQRIRHNLATEQQYPLLRGFMRSSGKRNENANIL